MIAIKDRTVLRSLLVVPFHLTLLEILWWIDESWPDRMTITCGYREGDIGSVHSTIPCRGVDLRHWVYEDAWAVDRKINEVWIYDSKRPKKKVSKLHDVGAGFHFHIQVCQNTGRR